VILEELLAKVEAYSRKTWDVEQFVVIETFLNPTWWGGQRRVIVVDVGWERARIALFVRERDAKVVGNIFMGHPIPREQLPELTGEQALEIALRECRRLNYAVLGESAVTKKRGAWFVRTNRNFIGCHAGFTICDRTGVVMERYYLPR